MGGHKHDSCKKWSKGRCVYHLSSPFSPLFCSLPPSLNDKPLFFTPPPLLLASLCLSLTPQFLILHIFPFPVLPQHTLSHSPLLSLSYSPAQSSSALAVSSTPRCTLFFNRGGGWARYRESRRESEDGRGGGIIYTIIHAKRTLQLAPPSPPSPSLSHRSRCQTFYVLFSHAWLYRIWNTCQSRRPPPPPQPPPPSHTPTTALFANSILILTPPPPLCWDSAIHLWPEDTQQ